MTSKIWSKYTKVNEINKNPSIKSYLAKFDSIVKEIKYKNINEYHEMKERIERIQDIIKIYDVIEEKDRIYIVLDKKNNNDKIDKLLLKKKK